MSNLSAELGRVAGQQELILEEFKEAREARKQQYESIEDIRQSMTTLDGRMNAVETSITTWAPTIQEFITIKHRVIGAGRLGKWLWIIVVALITLIYKFRGEMLAWFAR